MRITDNTALQQNIAETKKYIKISTTTIETELAAVRTALTGKQDTLTFDSTPTQNSNNPVKSDGIYDSEKDIYAVMGEMGAKNLIPSDMVKTVNSVGEWTGDNTYVNSGITWEFNPTDGTVTAVSGTATADSTFYYTVRNSTHGIDLKASTYTLSGCPDGGTIDTYKLYINSKIQSNNVNGKGLSNYGGENSITYSNDMWIGCFAAIIRGYEITTPITFKPMLRLASDTDNTYQPYAKTNKQLTDEIANKVDKVEGKGLSTNDYSDTEKGKVADNTAAIAELTEETSGVWDSINGVYIGRDLTVVFAHEIARYTDEWAWIQARLNAHNVSGLRVGDYIPIKVGTENHIAEIAGINTYRRTGDSGHEVGYHIDWITRDCYSQTVQFNTTNINNGNASNSSPFLASNLKSWLDGTLYPLLETKLKNVIKSKRILAPYRYQSGATLTDDNLWGWEDFTKLWVPLETEIFDCLVWSTKGFGNGQAVQYPIFANSYTHRIKGAGPGGARATWWTASAHSGHSTYVVYVSAHGLSYYDHASYAFCVPVCFRTMEA